jgi:hypothetical protein
MIMMIENRNSWWVALTSDDQGNFDEVDAFTCARLYTLRMRPENVIRSFLRSWSIYMEYKLRQ